MKIKPVGFYVLIEDVVVEEKTSGGIILPDTAKDREQEGVDFGWIRAFGPIAFLGYEGCEGPSDWGVKVGDKVEFRRYEGKRSNAVEGDGPRLRYVPDSSIIGVVE